MAATGECKRFFFEKKKQKLLLIKDLLLSLCTGRFVWWACLSHLIKRIHDAAKKIRQNRCQGADRRTGERSTIAGTAPT
jgi:hypothetical protein